MAAFIAAPLLVLITIYFCFLYSTFWCTKESLSKVKKKKQTLLLYHEFSATEKKPANVLINSYCPCEGMVQDLPICAFIQLLCGISLICTGNSTWFCKLHALVITYPLILSFQEGIFPITHLYLTSMHC